MKHSEMTNQYLQKDTMTSFIKNENTLKEMPFSKTIKVYNKIESNKLRENILKKQTLRLRITK